MDPIEKIEAELNKREKYVSLKAKWLQVETDIGSKYIINVEDVLGIIVYPSHKTYITSYGRTFPKLTNAPLLKAFENALTLKTLDGGVLYTHPDAVDDVSANPRGKVCVTIGSYTMNIRHELPYVLAEFNLLER